MPASTKCFQGIATSVVSKSLSGSGIITCFVIASCPPIARSPGRCFLTEYRLAQHHKYTTLDFRRAHPRRGGSGVVWSGDAAPFVSPDPYGSCAVPFVSAGPAAVAAQQPSRDGQTPPFDRRTTESRN